MQKQKRKDGDKGNGGGGGSSSSTSTTTTRSSQTSVTTITTTSIKTTTPTTITTLVTSINGPGSAPSAEQSGPGQSATGPTSGGGRITPPPQSLPPNQNLPSGSSSSNQSAATVSSSSSPSSTSRPVFRFDDLANATLCSPFGLSWTYSGQTSVAMTLTVQQSMSQSTSTTTSSSLPPGSPATMRILTTNVLSNADNFIWTSVDVMEGWYIAKAFDTSAALGISAGSTPFFVMQGSDTSCLLKVPTSTMSNPPPSQSISSGPSGNSTPSIGTGDIVGITLGVTAGAICLLLALFTLPRLRLRDAPSTITGPMKPRRPSLLY